MADYDLGTARGTIEINYDGSGVTQAQAGMRGLGSQADASARKMNKTGTLMAGAGLVIAGGLAVAGKAAADFESNLSQVSAVLGATPAEMDLLRDKALQLGKDTAFSAGESAKAMEELAKAGLTTEDILNGAADATVALAAAGQVDMATAAGIASAAMNSYSLEASEAAKVADLMAGAANRSATDVVGVGEAFKYVAPLAAAMGVSIEDSTTSIAALAKVGITGSQAGTTLRSMLQRLNPASKSAAEAMKELGIITEDGSNRFFDAQGNTKSMAEISGILQESLSGLSDEQKSAALNTIFGARAMAGATALAKQGKDGFQDLAKSIGDVSAEDVAEERMNNLKGSIELMKGSLETLLIVIGTPLLNGFRGIVDGVTALLNIFLSLPEGVQQAMLAFAGVLSVLLIAAGLFLKLKAAILLGSGALSLFAGPIGLIIAAIAALVAAFVYFYKTNETFRNFVQQAGAALRDFLGAAIEWLVPKLVQFGQFMVQMFQAALPYIIRFGQSVISAFQTAWPYIQRFGGFLKELGSIVINEIWPVFKDFMGAVIQLGAALIARLMPAFRQVGAGFRLIMTFAKIAMAVFRNVVWPVLSAVGKLFFRIFGAVIGNALRTGLGIIRGVLNIITGVIKVFTGLLTGNWRKAWDGVKQILRGAVGAIVSILKGLFKTAASIIVNLGKTLVNGIKKIPGLIKGIGGAFLAAGKFLIDQFANGIKNAAGIISGIAGNVWNFVRGLLNGAISQINNALEFTIDPPGPGKVTVNPPDIPQLAQGAVIGAPTLAWIGEGTEQEAVTPLSWLEGMIERVWLASLQRATPDPADGISARYGGGSSGMGGAMTVRGVLSIDEQGRAFLRGVAEEAVDDDRDTSDRASRRGGGRRR